MKYVIPADLIGINKEVIITVSDSSFEYDGTSLTAELCEGHRLIGTLTFDVTDDENGELRISGDTSVDDAEYLLGCDPSGYDLGSWLDAYESLEADLIDALNDFLKDCE